ncbi:MAG: hypothetical protein R3241_03555 [Rheinheimera sp.]|nr:hypothetical protein [Rheinheimera sp.]
MAECKNKLTKMSANGGLALQLTAESFVMAGCGSTQVMRVNHGFSLAGNEYAAERVADISGSDTT